MAAAPYRKKLIEVAIPLDAINRESAREKSIRHGHPSTLHLWWARRPLAACRAVIFCSLVDDPESPGAPAALLERIDALEQPLPLPGDWDAMDRAEQRRQRLFHFIAKLVKWESTTDEEIIGTARELILAATDGNPPPLLDPFCGGGSIPLEAQRLGLEAHGSDLNPVAVLITKALIELPPKFAGMPPVNPDARAELGNDAEWKGAAGLAADVRWYGEWMRERAWERIGHLYPQGPNGETVIAWLWARTVKCPNPACGAEMPLASTFWLSKSKNNKAWLVPVVDKATNTISFEVERGTPADAASIQRGAKIGRGAKFKCLACSGVPDDQHIKDEGMARRLGEMPLAVVAEGYRARTYLSVADTGTPPSVGRPEATGLDANIPDDPRALWCKLYGLETFADLFTDRQLTSLTTFGDLVSEARQLVRDHATEASDRYGDSYADVIATYVAFAVGRNTDRWCSLAWWQSTGDKVARAFARQGLPMVWDFAEANPFSNSTANWIGSIEWIAEALEALPLVAKTGRTTQADAARSASAVDSAIVVTDPPYYDNIVYADIADLPYVWLRRMVGEIYSEEFATLQTPKAQELVAAPYRFGGDRKAAEQHFELGLGAAFKLLAAQATTSTPMPIFYAYKQAEQRSADGQVASTGWERMLSALLSSGFAITGTWPMRTERGGRPVSIRASALATSVLIACRLRPADAPMADLQEFNRALETELPEALQRFIGEHIAPVDLPQASIGPGMAVFSRYSAVVLPNGEHMTVRRALELINEGVERFFSEQEGAFDGATQFCVRWFEQFGFESGPFDPAHSMAQAKNLALRELTHNGLLTDSRGRVQLVPFARYAATWRTWRPAEGRRLTAWEACHYLSAALEEGGIMGSQSGEHDAHDAGGAARVARDLGSAAGPAIDLAYRLYAICDAKGLAGEARRYNNLADSWAEISGEAHRLAAARQGVLG